jgi:hypothetical protein
MIISFSSLLRNTVFIILIFDQIVKVSLQFHAKTAPPRGRCRFACCVTDQLQPQQKISSAMMRIQIQLSPRKLHRQPLFIISASVSWISRAAFLAPALLSYDEGAGMFPLFVEKKTAAAQGATAVGFAYLIQADSVHYPYQRSA